MDIWQDPWVPSSESRKVITLIGGTMLSKVEELIDRHLGMWDEELIRSVFSIVDVNRILQIPLRVELVDDFEAWNGTRSGTFSFKSAYHIEFKHQFGRHWQWGEGHSGSQLNDILKIIWGLALPMKVKHFAWKSLKGVLPCFGTLAGRHIRVSAE